MAFSISTLGIPIGEVNHYSKDFRVVIENHLNVLFTSNKTKLLEVTDQASLKYLGDFYGLLYFLGVEQDLHWIVLRVNKLHNTLNYDGNLKSIRIPSRQEINILLARQLTLPKKT